MDFYEYHQNNSGGRFDLELGENVYIQATTADEANSIAQNNGIYFDGVEDGRDCQCCGDRWYEADFGDKVNSDAISITVKKILSNEIDTKIAIIFHDEVIISFERNGKDNKDNLEIFLDRIK